MSIVKEQFERLTPAARKIFEDWTPPTTEQLELYLSAHEEFQRELRAAGIDGDELMNEYMAERRLEQVRRMNEKC